MSCGPSRWPTYAPIPVRNPARMYGPLAGGRLTTVCVAETSAGPGPDRRRWTDGGLVAGRVKRLRLVRTGRQWTTRHAPDDDGPQKEGRATAPRTPTRAAAPPATRASRHLTGATAAPGRPRPSPNGVRQGLNPWNPAGGRASRAARPRDRPSPSATARRGHSTPPRPESDPEESPGPRSPVATLAVR